MGGDYTRFTFEPRDNHSGVLMQQGRVQLDADWNELVEIFSRRLRAETIDIIGRAVVPRETPDGFLIQASGGQITIGRGRAYVDGLLAENHGTGDAEFDPTLEEMAWPDPLPYDQQPWYPNAPALPESGTHLVYLDVWQREVTYLEEPEILEKGVGVDTATRLQTVWQVKLHSPDNQSLTCSTPDDAVAGWQELTAPSDGRLSTRAIGSAASDDPCYLNPEGGFRGHENRLYRIEIHDGGGVGEATFKWSRDNGSVATSVLGINTDRDLLTVALVGRDRELRFSIGDWVEITDDWRELHGLPGVMRKVGDVDDAARTIELEDPLPAGMFPTSGVDSLTDPDRHTRVRRWDHREIVLDVDGNEVADVDASDGVIPVPAAGVEVVLEDGVVASFSLARDAGDFHSGDYWVFAARTVDASVEELVEAPPRGIHHHYCRLAVVTFPDAEDSCRVLWPPIVEGGGCDCDRCVSAESHNSGTLTIQSAIDEVKDHGGTVCLGPGVFIVDQPILISRANSLRVRGKGWQTLLIVRTAGDNRIGVPGITIEGSTNCTVEEMAVVTTSLEEGRLEEIVRLGASIPAALLAVAVAAISTTPTGPVVLMRNSVDTTLRRTLLAQGGFQRGNAPVVALNALMMVTTIHDNMMLGASGISSMFGGTATHETTFLLRSYLLTAGLVIRDNMIAAGDIGVGFAGLALHVADVRISHNTVLGPRNGIGSIGAVLSSDVANQGDDAAELPINAVASRLEITSNIVGVRGNGIIVGTDDARVSGNDVSAWGGVGQNGIVLLTGLDQTGLDRCQVLDNRISGLGGAGILIAARVRSAMIKNNIIQSTAGGGIVMGDDARAVGISVDNNQILGVSPGTVEGETEDLVGIRLVAAEQASIAGNTVAGVARVAIRASARTGIQALLCPSVRISGNEVSDIGPESDFIGPAVGIDVQGPFDRADVVDNVVRRTTSGDELKDDAHWVALRIGSATKSESGEFTGRMIAVVTEQMVDTSRRMVRTPITYLISDNSIAELPPVRELIGARGNLLDTFGRGPVAVIAGTGATTFSDNRCILTNAARSLAVRMDVGAIVMSGNYVDSGAGDRSVELTVRHDNAFTVLGNITTGEIQLNGASLPAPWNQLNVVGI